MERAQGTGQERHLPGPGDIGWDGIQDRIGPRIGLCCKDVRWDSVYGRMGDSPGLYKKDQPYEQGRNEGWTGAGRFTGND